MSVPKTGGSAIVSARSPFPVSQIPVGSDIFVTTAAGTSIPVRLLYKEKVTGSVHKLLVASRFDPGPKKGLVVVGSDPGMLNLILPPCFSKHTRTLRIWSELVVQGAYVASPPTSDGAGLFDDQIAFLRGDSNVRYERDYILQRQRWKARYSDLVAALGPVIQGGPTSATGIVVNFLAPEVRPATTYDTYAALEVGSIASVPLFEAGRPQIVTALVIGPQMRDGQDGVVFFLPSRYDKATSEELDAGMAPWLTSTGLMGDGERVVVLDAETTLEEYLTVVGADRKASPTVLERERSLGWYEATWDDPPSEGAPERAGGLPGRSRQEPRKGVVVWVSAAALNYRGGILDEIHRKMEPTLTAWSEPDALDESEESPASDQTPRASFFSGDDEFCTAWKKNGPALLEILPTRGRDVWIRDAKGVLLVGNLHSVDGDRVRVRFPVGAAIDAVKTAECPTPGYVDYYVNKSRIQAIRTMTPGSYFRVVNGPGLDEVRGADPWRDEWRVRGDTGVGKDGVSAPKDEKDTASSASVAADADSSETTQLKLEERRALIQSMVGQEVYCPDYPSNEDPGIAVHGKVVGCTPTGRAIVVATSDEASLRKFLYTGSLPVKLSSSEGKWGGKGGFSYELPLEDIREVAATKSAADSKRGASAASPAPLKYEEIVRPDASAISTFVRSPLGRVYAVVRAHSAPGCVIVRGAPDNPKEPGIEPYGELQADAVRRMFVADVAVAKFTTV